MAAKLAFFFFFFGSDVVIERVHVHTTYGGRGQKS